MSGLGYSIKMSDDDQTATLQLRADEPITWRKLITMLRDWADQLEEEYKDDGEETFQ